MSSHTNTNTNNKDTNKGMDWTSTPVQRKSQTTVPPSSLATTTTTSIEEPPFFADAMLDLDEAHDIADTPEATRPNMVDRSNIVTANRARLQVPSLTLLREESADPTTAVAAESGGEKATNATVEDERIRTQEWNDTNHTNNKDTNVGNARTEESTIPTDSHQSHSACAYHDSSTAPITATATATATHKTSNTSNTKNNTTNNPSSSSSSSFALSSIRRDTSNICQVPQRKPRWPRDVSWTLAFWATVPWILLVMATRVRAARHANTSATTTTFLAPLATHPLSFATLHATTWSTLCVVWLARSLYYHSVAGWEGEARRHQAARTMAVTAPCGVAVSAALAITVWTACRNHNGIAATSTTTSTTTSTSGRENNADAQWLALLFAAWCIRDVLAFRRWNRRSPQGHGGYASRIALFSALVGMALDVLSRSLRRASFFRVLTALLTLQLVLLLLWRSAILGALTWFTNSHSGLVRATGLLVTLVAGKWATAVVSRVLSLTASAGVMHWCAGQAVLLSHVEEENPQTGGGQSDARLDTKEEEDYEYESDGGSGGGGDGGGYGITAAYRTVDASIYQSVVELDDALDDDYDLDEDEGGNNNWNDPSPRRSAQSPRGASPFRDQSGKRGGVQGNSSSNSGGGMMMGGRLGGSHGGALDFTGASTDTSIPNRVTVKEIVWTGLTVNFGAICHCALLGGLAQFVWSQVRRVELTQSAIQARRQQRLMGRRVGGHRDDDDLQGMAIGSSSDGPVYSDSGVWSSLYQKLLVLARDFVRQHSDLAMTHVAAYYKGYSRAARDVATVIDESRLEPILHEDIVTHMCTCVGGALSGTIVLITTYLLLHQRKQHPSVTDIHVVQSMLLSFLLSYTFIMTVLEPLRAAIKAIYVSFAQTPRCISQAYPLIYHRLNRMSEQGNPQQVV